MTSCSSGTSCPFTLFFTYKRGLCGTTFTDSISVVVLCSDVDNASNNDTLEIDNLVSTKRVRVYKSSRHNTASRGECPPPTFEIIRPWLHLTHFIGTWLNALVRCIEEHRKSQLQATWESVSNLLNLYTTASNQGPRTTRSLVEVKIYEISTNMKSILNLMK
jgi:hypothetical protein